MTNILHHIIQFFCEMTIAKWLIFTLISFIFDLFCNYILSFWSKKFQFFIQEWMDGRFYEYKMIIARNFLWPIYAPFKFIYTLGFFVAYKRYEFDGDFKLDD